MTYSGTLGTADPQVFWLDDAAHRGWLAQDARRQLDFFRASIGPGGEMLALDHDGAPIPGAPSELHAVTRLIHSYALAEIAGYPGAAEMVEAGLRALDRHRDADHGGFFWSVGADGPVNDQKLAYGHVFVLLAGSTAKMAGHTDADGLLAEAAALLDAHFWEEDRGLFRDEFARDWAPFSTYRGMNCNMHGVEALMAAFEATGEALYLKRAGRILQFFTARTAPSYGWRIPEHYDDGWHVDHGASGDPMFRPSGTTPGHSLEFARLLLQFWELGERRDETAPARARHLVDQALRDGWREDGGLIYTRAPNRSDRYWWPVCEGIGAIASMVKLERRPYDEDWYRRLWSFAQSHFVDETRGGWYPALDEAGQPTEGQFIGKPDIYHALQADLFALAPGLSRQAEGLKGLFS